MVYLRDYRFPLPFDGAQFPLQGKPKKMMYYEVLFAIVVLTDWATFIWFIFKKKIVFICFWCIIWITSQISQTQRTNWIDDFTGNWAVAPILQLFNLNYLMGTCHNENFIFAPYPYSLLCYQFMPQLSFKIISMVVLEYWSDEYNNYELLFHGCSLFFTSIIVIVLLQFAGYQGSSTIGTVCLFQDYRKLTACIFTGAVLRTIFWALLLKENWIIALCFVFVNMFFNIHTIANMDHHIPEFFPLAECDSWKFVVYLGIFMGGFLGATLSRVIFLQGMLLLRNRFCHRHFCDGQPREFWLSLPIYFGIGVSLVFHRYGIIAGVLFFLLWICYINLSCYCFTFVFVMFRPKRAEINQALFRRLVSSPAEEFCLQQGKRYSDRVQDVTRTSLKRFPGLIEKLVWDYVGTPCNLEQAINEEFISHSSFTMTLRLLRFSWEVQLKNLLIWRGEEPEEWRKIYDEFVSKLEWSRNPHARRGKQAIFHNLNLDTYPRYEEDDPYEVI